jgi:hypothetical protein
VGRPAEVYVADRGDPNHSRGLDHVPDNQSRTRPRQR